MVNEEEVGVFSSSGPHSTPHWGGRPPSGSGPSCTSALSRGASPKRTPVADHARPHAQRRLSGRRRGGGRRRRPKIRRRRRKIGITHRSVVGERKESSSSSNDRDVKAQLRLSRYLAVRALDREATMAKDTMQMWRTAIVLFENARRRPIRRKQVIRHMSKGAGNSKRPIGCWRDNSRCVRGWRRRRRRGRGRLRRRSRHRGGSASGALPLSRLRIRR